MNGYFLAEKTVKNTVENYVSGLLTKLCITGERRRRWVEQPCSVDGREISGKRLRVPSGIGPLVAGDLRPSLRRQARTRLVV